MFPFKKKKMEWMGASIGPSFVHGPFWRGTLRDYFQDPLLFPFLFLEVISSVYFRFLKMKLMMMKLTDEYEEERRRMRTRSREANCFHFEFFNNYISPTNGFFIFILRKIKLYQLAGMRDFAGRKIRTIWIIILTPFSYLVSLGLIPYAKGCCLSSFRQFYDNGLETSCLHE